MKSPQSLSHCPYLENSVRWEEKTVIITVPKKDEEIMGLTFNLHEPPLAVITTTSPIFLFLSKTGVVPADS